MQHYFIKGTANGIMTSRKLSKKYAGDSEKSECCLSGVVDHGEAKSAIIMRTAYVITPTTRKDSKFPFERAANGNKHEGSCSVAFWIVEITKSRPKSICVISKYLGQGINQVRFPYET